MSVIFLQLTKLTTGIKCCISFLVCLIVSVAYIDIQVLFCLGLSNLSHDLV